MHGGHTQEGKGAKETERETAHVHVHRGGRAYLDVEMRTGNLIPQESHVFSDSHVRQVLVLFFVALLPTCCPVVLEPQLVQQSVDEGRMKRVQMRDIGSILWHFLKGIPPQKCEYKARL